MVFIAKLDDKMTKWQSLSGRNSLIYSNFVNFATLPHQKFCRDSGMPIFRYTVQKFRPLAPDLIRQFLHRLNLEGKCYQLRGNPRPLPYLHPKEKPTTPQQFSSLTI